MTTSQLRQNLITVLPRIADLAETLNGADRGLHDGGLKGGAKKYVLTSIEKILVDHGTEAAQAEADQHFDGSLFDFGKHLGKMTAGRATGDEFYASGDDGELSPYAS